MSKNKFAVVEICLSDIESAIQAVQGGATSLELCSNRIEGGITPSVGFVEECVHLFKETGIEINVLVRPRPGDFCYTSTEFSIIERDIKAINRAGATGFKP
jgi:copper homeostasis protein